MSISKCAILHRERDGDVLCARSDIIESEKVKKGRHTSSWIRQRCSLLFYLVLVHFLAVNCTICASIWPLHIFSKVSRTWNFARAESMSCISCPVPGPNSTSCQGPGSKVNAKQLKTTSTYLHLTARKIAHLCVQCLRVHSSTKLQGALRTVASAPVL